MVIVRVRIILPNPNSNQGHLYFKGCYCKHWREIPKANPKPNPNPNPK